MVEAPDLHGMVPTSTPNKYEVLIAFKCCSGSNGSTTMPLSSWFEFRQFAALVELHNTYGMVLKSSRWTHNHAPLTNFVVCFEFGDLASFSFHMLGYI
jgi:hypothetical protein